MGFYFRRSINLGGGVRLNLSGRGLGISAGVRGFRVGLNGRGTYVHMGGGGLYYRQQFSYKRAAAHAPPSAPADRGTVQPDIIYTEDLAAPLAVAASATDAQHVIDHFKPRFSWVWLPWVFGALALFSAANVLAAALWAACCLVAVAVIELLKVREILVYDLDESTLGAYEAFVIEFESYFSSSRIWHYTQRSLTHDLKRSAGANWLMDRRAANVSTDTARVLRVNISAPCIESGGEKVVFLPDLVVFVSGREVVGLPYSRVSLAARSSLFVENAQVPADAQVVDYAWRFSNKDGGPDRRFNNNRRYPVCLYEEIGFAVNDTFARVFAKSSTKDFSPFNQAFDRMSKIVMKMNELPAPGGAATG